MTLSNNTVTRRMDEMGEDIETQLVEKLKSGNLSLQMDESTLRDSKFAEEMQFSKSLETTTIAADIYGKLTNYLIVNNIPMENIISCAADGAPTMIGKKIGCLKLMKDENPEMILVYCVIHRENLVAMMHKIANFGDPSLSFGHSDFRSDLENIY
ncbi:SCAN domain-containing protein 3-like [Lepeophtheirus salmonis]|uniref:SCAN domain-containing protein 3-like n=1 Tax=Lepeophtheirus salmonis TaxID=72036 RepID=UPI003AF34E8B